MKLLVCNSIARVRAERRCGQLSKSISTTSANQVDKDKIGEVIGECDLN